MVKRSIGSVDVLPSFPKKKLFGNTDPVFLEQRKLQIQTFLQLFLAHPQVKTCKLVLVYFRSKAFDAESKDAIENLCAYMEGKQVATQKAPDGRIAGHIEQRMTT